MKIVVFGLTVSSSWGNGHATLWRGLCRALARRGHSVVFFERDVPYYAAHRDLTTLAGGRLLLYSNWADALQEARRHLAEADAGLVTSYCPDGIAATGLLLERCAGLRVFYDLDTPITLERFRAGESLSYVGPRGLADFDLVLSFTGGASLHALQLQLGARCVRPLYGWVDPDIHKPVAPLPAYASHLSYLGTYAPDRQEALERFFLQPARQLPKRKFVLGGAQYPEWFPWTENIYFVRHLPPSEHPAFFCSSRLTLNITRSAMAQAGYCPSGRLFEAAACGTPLLSDWWEGLESFFEPGTEILVARTTEDAVRSLELSEAELAQIARAARERTLAAHTAEQRAAELERAFQEAGRPALEPRAFPVPVENQPT